MTLTLDDIEPGNFIVKNSSRFGSSNLDFMSTVTFQIGHVFGGGYSLSNSFTDGGTTLYVTKDELLKHLNSYEKGYRLLTLDEFRTLSVFKLNNWS